MYFICNYCDHHIPDLVKFNTFHVVSKIKQVGINTLYDLNVKYCF